jgi:putative DNA primase/helicase
MHQNGTRYEWLVTFDQAPLPAIPKWLIAKPAEKKPIKDLYSGSYTGSRNDTLARLTGSWVNDGGTFQEILEQALVWNQVNKPPLSEAEVKKTVQSIFDTHNRKYDIEPAPLPDDLLTVATFDYDLLPSTLQPWIKDICDRMQCPPDFVAVAVMTALGSVVGRKVGIRPQGLTDWTVTPNMWALAVGRPGVMKSPALEAALSPLKVLAAKANETYSQAHDDFQVEQRATKLRMEASEKAARVKLKQDPKADLSAVLAVPEQDEPTLKRYLVNDTSPAALGELHRQNHNGFLVHRDEMVSLLRSLDREDQAEGRGFYLTGWNGDSAYTFDRIGRGMNLHIPAVCISLLGGTQPGRLSGYIDQAVKGGSADDGLIQRFGLIVWPDVNTDWKNVDRHPDSDAKRQANKIFDLLDKLDAQEIGAQQDTDCDGNPDGMPYLRFDNEARELFLGWREDLESRLRGGDLHPALESHLAKYRKLVPGLALVLHLAEGNRGPVTAKATLQALAWSEYLETHAQRAYTSATQPRTSTAKAIVKHIRNNDLSDHFSGKEVWRPGWSKLTDRSQVSDALRLLVDYGWLFESHDKETGGRPSTTYKVNPKVMS